eukprot:TRINITY_DN6843_c0_g1_i2.p1 TRINITY_DN6843_c0_g1~~TRINITY_DN6843_c0_g1_i2.p1  ORF type:complete len:179 (+),score=40.89 TRINITY_DN6843_c0_g1_i2:882-1418(+)
MESSSIVQIKEQPREEIVLDEEEGTVSCRPSVDISIDSLNYSDAEDQSWHSPYDSNGGTYDEYDYSSGSDLEPAEATDQPTKVSVADESEVDLEKGPDEPNRSEPVAQPNQGPRIVRSVSKAEKDCRICHLSLETAHEAGTSIVLGCSCKADLAAAHKQCAEAWFKIRGNSCGCRDGT